MNDVVLPFKRNRLIWIKKKGDGETNGVKVGGADEELFGVQLDLGMAEGDFRILKQAR